MMGQTATREKPGGGMSQTLDVSRFIDERRLGAFNVKLVALCTLAIFFDGYDLLAISYTAPAMIKELDLANQGQFTSVFTAGLVGILIGSLVFGYVGDRFGRKTAIVVSCLVFGLFTWATVLCTTLNEIVAVRLLAGLGLGGLLPNVFALTGEFTPRRIRVAMTVIVNLGIAIGAASSGPVAAWLMPQYGWQILFSIGGILSLLVAVALWLALSESVKYQVLHGERDKAIATLRRMEPSLEIALDTVFVMRDETAFKGLSPAHLFEGRLKLITPLVWVMFIGSFMTSFFLLSWLPVLLTNASIPQSKAVIFASIIQLGSFAGALIMSRMLDKWGMKPITVYFILSVFFVAALGYAAVVPEAVVGATIFLVGFFGLGVQIGVNGLTPTFYPSAYRASGAGWALGLARIGSILGATIGGIMIGEKLSLTALYFWAALPLAVCAVIALILVPVLSLHAASLAAARSGDVAAGPDDIAGEVKAT
jgi:MFS transporter, AAHS family, 4-hydroxybenzoate transporter